MHSKLINTIQLIKNSLQEQTTPAGSVLHTPALVQMAVISPSGDNPGLHWKDITDPSIVTMLL